VSFRRAEPALGYLRADLSGVRQPWDEIRMRHLAPRLGYNLRKTIVFTAATDNRIEQLLAQIERHGARALFVPHPRHLDGRVEEIRAGVGVVVDLEDEPAPTAIERVIPHYEAGWLGMWRWLSG